ncbi:MAG: hypothetical protein Q9218_002605 [Villophora microphyllina]
MPLPTILVVGSLNTDLVTRTPHFPKPGETVTSTSFSIGCGGKGANQAVACARSSRSKDAESTVDVRMVGAVGDDLFGTKLVSSLKDDGIDTAYVNTVHGQSTGTANIVVEESTGENQILVNPGANHFVQPALSSTNMIILQLEIPVGIVFKVLQSAKEIEIPVLLNPSPVVVLPDHIYKDLDHLIMNEGEAALLSGLDRGDLPLHKYLDKVCDKFHQLGVKNVIVTLGAYGVFYSTNANKRGHVAAAKVNEVVDTTAAGDTFVGAYAVEIVVSKASVESAVTWATKAAAKTVEKKGAQSSIPWRDEVV